MAVVQRNMAIQSACPESRCIPSASTSWLNIHPCPLLQAPAADGNVAVGTVATAALMRPRDGAGLALAGAAAAGAGAGWTSGGKM